MKTKHTKGNWHIHPLTYLNRPEFIRIVTTTELSPVVASIDVGQHFDGKERISLKEAEANANLIVDAGNTANKTGLLPSQILEQRNELLEALQAFVDAYPKVGKFKDEFSNEVVPDEITNPIYVSAINAIKKTTSNTY